MSLGNTIKKLRRERDMTQEELAELLSITPQAISRWENDSAMPDISLLPRICYIFNISSDELLGIDKSRKQEKIKELYEKIRELWCTAQRDEAERRCREALEQFPDAYDIMEELAWNLSYSDDPAGIEESIRLFERIRANVSDENKRNFALGNLCELYMKAGKAGKAKQLAESVPVLAYTKSDCIRMTLHGSERADFTRTQIAEAFDELVWRIVNLARAFGEDHPLFNTNELLLLWQKVITFVEEFYENGDYHYQEQCVMLAHYHRARLYISLNEFDKAMDELEMLQKNIVHFDHYAEGMFGDHVVLPREKWHTSILVRPAEGSKAEQAITVIADTTENAAMEFMKKLSDKRFDAMRTNKRFTDIMAALKEAARA